MSQMQTKILAELDRLAEQHQLERVHVSAYANTGHVYYQYGFLTEFMLQYQFNDTYCTLTFSGSAVEAIIGGGGTTPEAFRADGNRWTAHHLDYADKTRLDGLLGLRAAARRMRVAGP